MSLRDRALRWLGVRGYATGGYTRAYECLAIVGEATIIDEFPWMKRSGPYSEAMLALLNKDPRAAIIEINFEQEAAALTPRHCHPDIKAEIRRAIRKARGLPAEATILHFPTQTRKKD